MRWVLAYIVIAFVLNVVVSVFRPVGGLLRSGVIGVLTAVSYPVSKGLGFVKSGFDRYLVLISVEEENKRLKRELAHCILINKELERFEKKDDKKGYSDLIEASFSFKGNFENDEIYLYVKKNLNLEENNCFVLSHKLALVGLVKRRVKKDIYVAQTVFNPSFVADVYIKSENGTFKALFMGSEYRPKVEFLDPNVKLNRGDGVYTTSALGIYPYGLFIGRVAQIKDVNGYYKVAYVDIDKSFFNDWQVFVLCRRKQ